MKKYWFIMPFYNPHVAGIVPFLARFYQVHIVTFEDNLREGKEWQEMPEYVHASRIVGIGDVISIFREITSHDVIGFYGVLYNLQYFLFCFGASLQTGTIQVFSEGFKKFQIRRLFLLSSLPWHKMSLFGIGHNSVIDYQEHLTLSNPRKTYTGFAFPFDLHLPQLEDTPRKYFSIFVGQLIQRKNVESFLQFAHSCLAVNPDLKFMIVGAGPKELELRRLCRTLDIESSVDWVKHSPRNQVLDLMANAKSLFLNSHYEGWGAVCLEAISCGTYLILGESVRSRSLLEGDDVGIIFDDEYLNNPRPIIYKIQNLTIDCRKRIQNHATLFSAESLSKIVLQDLNAF